jgi:hypothetical protein
VRSTNARDTADFDVERAACSTRGADRLGRAPVAAGRDTGEHPLKHDRGQRITIGEVRIRDKRHLAASIGATHARPLDRHPTAAERHLARLVPVTDGGALRVVLALHADDLDDFLFHELGQHTQPDADAQRQQPFSCRADQLSERLLHPRRQRDLAAADLLPRYGLHGGSSSCRLTISHSPRSRRDRTRREDRHLKFYELWDNLRPPGVGGCLLDRPPLHPRLRQTAPLFLPQWLFRSDEQRSPPRMVFTQAVGMPIR